MPFLRIAIAVGILGHLSSPDARGQFGPDVAVDPTPAGLQLNPRVAVDPNDENHIVGVVDDWNSLRVRWLTSFDGGTTWATGALPSSGDAYGGVVAINLDGTAVAAAKDYWLGGSIYSYVSADGGLTWKLGSFVIGGFYPEIAIDLSDGPRRGRVALAAVSAGDTRSDVISVTSDDGGATWENFHVVLGGPHEFYGSASVAFGPGSELWVLGIKPTHDEIWTSRSSDGGESFDDPVRVADYVPIPGALRDGLRVSDSFSIAVDWTRGPHSGSVYVLYHRWDGSIRRADVYCGRSEDSGATWAKRNVNATDGTLADQFMPSAVVDEHGSLYVGYLDRRLDPSQRMLWTWIARSADGGRTFDEYQVSDVGWDPFATEAFKTAGDRFGLAATKHSLRAFFPDPGREASTSTRTWAPITRARRIGCSAVSRPRHRSRWAT